MPARDGDINEGQVQLRTGHHSGARGWRPPNCEGPCAARDGAGRGVSIEFHYVRISHLCM